MKKIIHMLFLVTSIIILIVIIPNMMIKNNLVINSYAPEIEGNKDKLEQLNDACIKIFKSNNSEEITNEANMMINILIKTYTNITKGNTGIIFYFSTMINIFVILSGIIILKLKPKYRYIAITLIITGIICTIMNLYGYCSLLNKYDSHLIMDL